MEWINKYLSCLYEDGARGPDKFDCWGLVRHVLHFELGRRLLPSYGSLRPKMPRGASQAYEAEVPLLEPCDAEHGAIACVLTGRICSHVAIVLDSPTGLRILETSAKRGPQFVALRRWLRDYHNVVYYRDRT
jgi:cell wall-associated NlpC family hydrolase